MFGNPRKERAILEGTYEDVFSVYDFTEERDSSNIMRKRQVEIVSSAHCAFSTTSHTGTSLEARQETDFTAKVYCAPEHAIRAGMKVEVMRFGTTPLGVFEVVGDPALYPTHQEVKIRAKRLA